MKKLINTVVLLFAATTLVNAQWTRNAGTAQTYTTFLGDSVGIGTTNPKFKLDVRATAASTMQLKSATDNANILLDRGTSANNASLIYRTAGVSNWQTGCIGGNNFTIKNNSLSQDAFFCNYANNNVGIGTNAPTQKLEVAGMIYSSAGGFKFPDGTIQPTAAVLGANTQLSNLGSTAVNASLIPNINNAVDLGSTTKGWRDIFLANKIYLGATSSPFIKKTGGICIGNLAGYNSTGNYNIFIGNSTGYVNTTGASNVFIGFDGGSNTTTGTGNTFIGDYIGGGNSTGNNNTLIGGGANVGASNLQNATAIGYGAVVGSSNSLILGNNDVQVGIGTTIPEAKLHINSNSTMTNPQLLLYENENDFARINFRNTATTNYWAIAGYNAASNGNARLNFFNSVAGNVMSLTGDGSVCIGTATPATGYKLSVAGKAICTELKVQLQANWPDYVFKKDYNLPSLNELENFVNKNNHLPGVPSAAAIEKEGGFEVGEMQKVLLQKLEEANLYIIQLNKRIESLEAKAGK